MLASSVAKRKVSLTIRDRLLVVLYWLAEAVTYEIVPLTGDPDVDAMLIEMYLRGASY